MGQLIGYDGRMERFIVVREGVLDRDTLQITRVDRVIAADLAEAWNMGPVNQTFKSKQKVSV